MGWPYRFIDLTDAEKLDRRELLDQSASVAQWTALVPLMIVPFCLYLSWARRRFTELAARSSPDRKGVRVRTGYADLFETYTRTWRQLRWWCSESTALGGFYFGRRGDIVVAVSWLSWLLFLCFIRTGEDYLHLTKRFGIVAASQLPLHYLLSLKSPFSPVQFLTRASHETLNAYHQLLGRVITILLYLHAILYLNFYIQKSLLAAKLREPYILCGIFGILSFTIVGTTALARVRKWSYRLFYITHVTLASAILPVLFFHVSHIRIYLYETAAIYGLNVLLRTLSSKQLDATLHLIPHTNLLEICVLMTVPSEEVKIHRWQPGQHAYISLHGHPLARTFGSNPFSLASLPSIDGRLRFVARILDGNTATLAREAASTKRPSHLTVEGPYGIPTHSEELLHYDRVLLIAGGVGGTFMVPIYRQLLSDLSPSKESYRRQKVTFVWVTKTFGDVAWALPEDSREREGFVERLETHLTGASGLRPPANRAIFSSEHIEDGGKMSYAETEEGIELEERKELLSEEANGFTEKGHDGLAVHAGRPDLRRLVDLTFSHGSSERVAVYVCGPTGLSRSVRPEVGRWVRKGRVVRFWEESFGL